MKLFKQFISVSALIVNALIIHNQTIAQPNIITVTGQVVAAETGEPLSNVNVFSGDTGTYTDSDGKFTLSIPSNVELTISIIGYKTVEVTPTATKLFIQLMPEVMETKEIFVLANRAVAGITPVAFSTLTRDEIAMHQSVEDIPMVLATEPGVYAYSESGNGTGYSYLSIRGFDQSRIAVMLDNVPLNDNESHQVYWVDHGDILSEAQDVQIQRGVGNSLYGSAAFGGSINLLTNIASETPQYELLLGVGSYNTRKYRLRYSSGDQLGKLWSIRTRVSQVESEGYRDHHDSFQRAFYLGIEHRTKSLINQFRLLAGYENTDLMWDGVYGDDIHNRILRRKGYRAYTDDFLQQVYSLNTTWFLSEDLFFHNVAYLVKGSGYYEGWKTDVDFYSYNLDTEDQFPDSVEIYDLTTDLLRRKWIVNSYFGAAPTVTLNRKKLRIDVGGELRWYQGDHFGEVSQFSNSLLDDLNTPYHYYEYLGKKRSATLFFHLTYLVTDRLRLILDTQFQSHNWTLDQKKIGHARGYQLMTDWNFFNPRTGFVYELNKNLSVFGNYGKSQKEPADDQIIEADDVWDEPVGKAAIEIVNNFELGCNYNGPDYFYNINLYRINFENEQLKIIDIEQEGEYDYYAVDGTVHQGIEIESGLLFSHNISMTFNGTLNQNLFSTGVLKNNNLPHIPDKLLNFVFKYSHSEVNQFYGNLRYIGKQYINNTNEEKNAIDPYFLINVGYEFKNGPLIIQIKVNNLLDKLFITHGEDWGGGWIAYWPGATNNSFVSISYRM